MESLDVTLPVEHIFAELFGSLENRLHLRRVGQTPFRWSMVVDGTLPIEQQPSRGAAPSRH